MGMCRAARLIRCADSTAVGGEQQLHHLERRAAHGGVVERQLPVLYYIIHGKAHAAKPWPQGAQQHGSSEERSTGGTRGRGDVAVRAVVLAERCTLSAAVAVAVALPSGPSSSFTTSNVTPFSAA
eukprot:scaffold42929_cov69-Phaeocystis_antarctica.AAC.6